VSPIFEYGDGYCLPIGYWDAAVQSIRSRRDMPAHLVLDPDLLNDYEVRPLKSEEACGRLRRGASILRSARRAG
jgi:hypothetical protein